MAGRLAQPRWSSSLARVRPLTSAFVAAAAGRSNPPCSTENTAEATMSCGRPNREPTPGSFPPAIAAAEDQPQQIMHFPRLASFGPLSLRDHGQVEHIRGHQARPGTEPGRIHAVEQPGGSRERPPSMSWSAWRASVPASRARKVAQIVIHSPFAGPHLSAGCSRGILCHGYNG